MIGNEKVLRVKIEKAILDAIEKKPLVPSITNTVTQDFVVNAQLAVGGSAAIVYLADECEKIIESADAFYVNTGTIMPFYAETLPRALRIVTERKKPWVLDPVAISLSSMRSELLKQMKDFKPPIIRGNASEIISLAKLWNIIDAETCGQIRGVDSIEKVSNAKNAAIALAKLTNGVTAVSGETDLITNGHEIYFSAGGSNLFTKITGSGCSLGGVMAVYSAVSTPLIAALTATLIYKTIGAKVSMKINSPASFKVNFLDGLYRINAREISEANLDFEEVNF